jgi:peptidyl-prolyl cis-trans isomerase C
VFQLKQGAWQGPVQWGYGWHLVFIGTIEPGRVPAFEEVETDIKSAWLDQKQSEIKQTAFEAMRRRYTVVVAPIDSIDWASLQTLHVTPTNVLPE